jgi:hypothetical protein
MGQRNGTARDDHTGQLTFTDYLSTHSWIHEKHDRNENGYMISSQID